MREHPWNQRRATNRHYQWFRNLADLHELTEAWLRELGSDRPSVLDTSTLELLKERDLESLLDDTYPDDTLGRLERTVWTFQATTLKNLLERASDATRRGALMTQLEQASWKQGRECAKSRWPALVGRMDEDLRKIFQSLQDSPMSFFPHGEPFLVKRALKEELHLELHACPHQSRFDEVKPAASDLCRLHLHWIRGFTYAMNSRVSIAGLKGANERCIHRWSFLA